MTDIELAEVSIACLSSFLQGYILTVGNIPIYSTIDTQYACDQISINISPEGLTHITCIQVSLPDCFFLFCLSSELPEALWLHGDSG